MVRAIVAVLAVFTAVPAAAAEGEARLPEVKVGGVLYAHYGVDLTEGADLFNEFAIDRTYLRADAKLPRRFAVRLTLDSGREKEQSITLADGTEIDVPEDPKVRVFVKHAWLEWGAPEGTGIKLRAGMTDTPYVGFQENVLGNRWLGSMFLDKFKLESTTDFGASAIGDHADGFVSWHVSVMNGETYNEPEDDGGKAFQGRFTLDPLAAGDLSLPLTAFADANLTAGGEVRLTYVGAVGLSHPNLGAWGEVVGVSEAGTSGFGFSATLLPRVPDVIGLQARVDRFDPDTAAADDAALRLVGAVTRDLAAKVAVGAAYEREIAEAAPGAPEHGVFLRMQAGF